MILLKSTTPQGRVHQCDARCYNGKGPTCACICGGINHGVGMGKAISATQQRYADHDASLEGLQMHPLLRFQQIELPEMPERIQILTPSVPERKESTTVPSSYVQPSLLEQY